MHVPQRQQNRRLAGDGPEPVRPVFLDQTGRRRRLTIIVGSTLAAGLLVSLAVIAVGLFTGAPVLIPGWSSGDSGGDDRPETRLERFGASPEAVSRDDAGPTTIPARGGTSSTPASPQPTRTPTSSPSPRPTSTDLPGQGALHRNTPTARPSKSPGKPS
jgi:hypothetical protein